MEKRDTEGETVKRENCAAGLGSGALETERGGGEPDTPEDVGRGSRGKSSSHSYPAPERRPQDAEEDAFSPFIHLKEFLTYSPLRCSHLKSRLRHSPCLEICSEDSDPPLLKRSHARPAP